MLIRLGEQNAATDLATVVKHIHVRGWETNPTKIQTSSTLVKFLWPLWSWAVQEGLPRWRSCCTYSLLLMRKMYNVPWISEATCTSYGYATMNHLPRLLSVRKAQNKRRLGNKYGLLWKVLWHLGNITHQIRCCLKHLWQIGILYGVYCRNVGDSQGRPLMFYFKTMLSCASNYCPFFEEQFLAYHRALEWMPDNGPPCYHVTWAVHYELSIVEPTKQYG